MGVGVKLFLIGDGLGKWRNVGLDSWFDSMEAASSFVERAVAIEVADECGGHVVEFTMGNDDSRDAAIKKAAADALDAVCAHAGVQRPANPTPATVARAVEAKLKAAATHCAHCGDPMAPGEKRACSAQDDPGGPCVAEAAGELADSKVTHALDRLLTGLRVVNAGPFKTLEDVAQALREHFEGQRILSMDTARRNALGELCDEAGMERPEILTPGTVADCIHDATERRARSAGEIARRRDLSILCADLCIPVDERNLTPGHVAKAVRNHFKEQQDDAIDKDLAGLADAIGLDYEAPDTLVAAIRDQLDQHTRIGEYACLESIRDELGLGCDNTLAAVCEAFDDKIRKAGDDIELHRGDVAERYTRQLERELGVTCPGDPRDPDTRDFAQAIRDHFEAQKSDGADVALAKVLSLLGVDSIDDVSEASEDDVAVAIREHFAAKAKAQQMAAMRALCRKLKVPERDWPSEAAGSIRDHFGQTSAGVVLRDMADGAGVKMEGAPLVSWGWVDLLQAIRADFAAQPEPREPDYWLARRPEAYGMYVMDLAGGVCIDKKSALRFAGPKTASDYGTPVPVYVGEPPPAPAEREPDAIMVCEPEDGSPDWDEVLPLPLAPNDRDRIERYSYTTRKVYLDTPPPTWPTERLRTALDDALAERDDAIAEVKRLKEDRGDALEEVSRLSKALHESRLERDKTVSNLLSQKDGLQELLDESRRKLDELAKQEPAAWRRERPDGMVDLSMRPTYGHLWKPLYAAPKPAEAQAPDGFNGPLTRKYAAMEDARDLNTCQACNAGPDMIGPVHTCEPAPADTPAMVEARRRVGEGWRAHPSIPDWAHHDESERSAPVGKAVVDAMRALRQERGGK